MMIQITPHMRILVAVEPIDFRAGIDGLVLACRQAPAGRSLRRCTVRLPQPRPHGDQGLGLRRPGLLDVPQAFVRAADSPGGPTASSPGARCRPASCRCCSWPAIRRALTPRRRGAR
ncbi:MAG: hypothetical protein MZW92_55290 [Comamonadaceae bacterium]|nr:hypothetical protein [Comamonadaceae bacterium]